MSLSNAIVDDALPSRLLSVRNGVLAVSLDRAMPPFERDSQPELQLSRTPFRTRLIIPIN